MKIEYKTMETAYLHSDNVTKALTFILYFDNENSLNMKTIFGT